MLWYQIFLLEVRGTVLFLNRVHAFESPVKIFRFVRWVRMTSSIERPARTCPLICVQMISKVGLSQATPRVPKSKPKRRYPMGFRPIFHRILATENWKPMPIELWKLVACATPPAVDLQLMPGFAAVDLRAIGAPGGRGRIFGTIFLTGIYRVLVGCGKNVCGRVSSAHLRWIVKKRRSFRGPSRRFFGFGPVWLDSSRFWLHLDASDDVTVRVGQRFACSESVGPCST